MNTLSIPFANEILELRPERTLWWARQQVLFVADLHLGAPDPTSDSLTASQAKLNRLDRELVQLDARVLCILGDLVHASMEWTEGFDATLKKLRHRYRHQRWLLIEGNHDCRWRQHIRDASIDVETPPQFYDPFWLMHDEARESSLIPIEQLSNVVMELAESTDEAAEGTPPIYALSAHLHPCVRPAPKDRSRKKSHCFWVQPSQIVLPSFATDRAVRAITPCENDQIYTIDETGVRLMPSLKESASETTSRERVSSSSQ